VYSQKQTSVITNRSGAASFAAFTACCTMPPSLYESRPTASFSAGMPNRMIPPRPSFAAVFASSAIKSTESWACPGIEPIGCRTPLPVRANSGKINFPGDSRVSRRRLRTAGWYRSRRNRVVGKREFAIGSL
jgi:hypothetical protein